MEAASSPCMPQHLPQCPPRNEPCIASDLTDLSLFCVIPLHLDVLSSLVAPLPSSARDHLQVKVLSCTSCGKPCRTDAERDMHTRMNPGHDQYVDKVSTRRGGEASWESAGLHGLHGWDVSWMVVDGASLPHLPPWISPREKDAPCLLSQGVPVHSLSHT